MNTQLETFSDLEKDITKSYSLLETEEKEVTKDIVEEVGEREEIGLNFKVPEETPIKDDEIRFTKDSFKDIEEKVLTDEIEEIKSFFASKDEEKSL